MKRIITAVVLIAIVFALILWNNPHALYLFSGLIACLAAIEYAQLTRAQGNAVPYWWIVPAVATIFVVTDLDPLFSPLPILSCLGLVLFIYSTFFCPLRESLPIAASGLFGLIYIAYPLSLIPQLRARDSGLPLLILLMLIVWTGDTVALYIGKAYGRHKLAPRISPGKTWEGAVGSLAGSVLISLLFIGLDFFLANHGFAVLHINQPLWFTLVIAAVVNVAAQIGDLVESAIKRGAGVKDSGTLLPGHGGVLDRIDALLVAAPVFWFLLLLRNSTSPGGY